MVLDLSSWTRTRDSLPPQDVLVETLIHDDIRGTRNRQRMSRRGRLWFVEDGSMYVYYTPTHWRELEAQDAE